MIETIIVLSCRHFEIKNFAQFLKSVSLFTFYLLQMADEAEVPVPGTSDNIKETLNSFKSEIKGKKPEFEKIHVLTSSQGTNSYIRHT